MAEVGDVWKKADDRIGIESCDKKLTINKFFGKVMDSHNLFDSLYISNKDDRTCPDRQSDKRLLDEFKRFVGI